MGDAAPTVIRRRQEPAPPTVEPVPHRIYPHAVPLPVTKGMMRVRGIHVERSGWVTRTYEIPPEVLAKYLIHERAPDTLPTASEQVYIDLYLESQ